MRRSDQQSTCLESPSVVPSMLSMVSIVFVFVFVVSVLCMVFVVSVMWLHRKIDFVTACKNMHGLIDAKLAHQRQKQLVDV